MVGGEQSWIVELVPPHLPRAPLPPSKLDVASGILDFDKLWKPPPNRDYVPCVEPSSNYTTSGGSQGYLLVHTNGGLNQMRAGICDMVAVARIINTTLVIPELDKRSFWQDTRSLENFRRNWQMQLEQLSTLEAGPVLIWNSLTRRKPFPSEELTNQKRTFLCHLYFKVLLFGIGPWHDADEYDGQVREIKLRALCNSPMCPPDIAMTEWQHAVLSPDKKQLVFETVQQTHDVPFGSYFEASQASLEWLMKKRKAFDRQGDMVVAAWAEQQQQHEMNLRVHRSRSKE